MQSPNESLNYGTQLSPACHYDGPAKTPDKTLQFMMNMIELKYLSYEDNAFQLTNSGINHMKQNFVKFMNNAKNANIDISQIRNFIINMPSEIQDQINKQPVQITTCKYSFIPTVEQFFEENKKKLSFVDNSMVIKYKNSILIDNDD